MCCLGSDDCWGAGLAAEKTLTDGRLEVSLGVNG